MIFSSYFTDYLRNFAAKFANFTFHTTNEDKI